MTNRQPSGSRAVRQMFSSIAGRYDFLNRLFSLGTDVKWRRELVGEIPEGDGPILDVATGTADVALALEENTIGSRLIVGSDFTLPMLQEGAKKVHRGRTRRVKLAAGDACSLPFYSGAFSAVTIAFGLRNIPHRLVSLREMARVLRPGGLILVLEFSRIERPLLGPLFRFYFHRVMPLIGGVVSGNRQAYRYLPDSVDAFPDPIELGEEMLKAGLVNVRCRPLTFGMAYLHVGEKPSNLQQ